MAWYCIVKGKSTLKILKSLTEIKSEFSNVAKDHICNGKQVYSSISETTGEKILFFSSRKNAVEDGFQYEVSIKYNGVVLDPKNDGITHINIYTKGKTDIGRVMTNMYHEDIEIDGITFPSIETYWHWLGVKSEYKDKIKNLSGFLAQKQGRIYKKEYGRDTSLSEEEFNKKIYDAIVLKGKKHLDLFKSLDKNNTLFVHYYDIYGNIVDKTDKSKPLIDACYYLLNIS